MMLPRIFAANGYTINILFTYIYLNFSCWKETPNLPHQMHPLVLRTWLSLMRRKDRRNVGNLRILAPHHGHTGDSTWIKQLNYVLNPWDRRFSVSFSVLSLLLIIYMAVPQIPCTVNYGFFTMVRLKRLYLQVNNHVTSCCFTLIFLTDRLSAYRETNHPW